MELERAGLKRLGYTPHCLRHGGASADAHTGSDATTIQLRGQWRNAKSVALNPVGIGDVMGKYKGDGTRCKGKDFAHTWLNESTDLVRVLCHPHCQFGGSVGLVVRPTRAHVRLTGWVVALSFF